MDMGSISGSIFFVFSLENFQTKRKVAKIMERISIYPSLNLLVY